MLDVNYVKAYAKINFGLNVYPKRGDGFHNIESIFQTINLYDELKVVTKKEKGCVVNCDLYKLPENNTLVLAYQAFCETVGVNVPGVEITLIKGIPSGGGLGGGSSDAAALVRVLENICGINLAEYQLNYIAEKTGSDVFFFLNCEEGRGCALVSGRGEIIKKIIPRKDLVLLLVFPKANSSTKEAYSLLDESFEKKNIVENIAFDDFEFIYNSNVKSWNFTNAFTPVLSKKITEIGSAIESLKQTSAEYVEISGSGSTVYGVFTMQQQAVFCSKMLADALNCRVVKVI
ncbi:MAG: 4-(cytidine 5'-diphospho)-2-C-methyl-D-erythritol kinase [Treponema sp.]|jgi:4-diphosphocytidyl-2-C-methyl-D-erythritol kinase|nr:4-(cytidine 5'-diphospho)-2-C-methyl-D-erythritol kinase [Treponema sp.]